MIKAYFIGGPLDLSVSSMQAPDKEYYVALPSQWVDLGMFYNRRSTDPLIETMRVGKYRLMGKAYYHNNTYIYEYEGERN